MKYEHHAHQEDLTEKLRNNPWIISTFILGLLAIILVVGSVSGGISGKTITQDRAAEYLLSYFESQGGSGFSIDSIDKEDSFYKINLDYQGQLIPFYVTRDGYLTGNSILSIIPKQGSDSQTGIPNESTEPMLECVEPYGLTSDTIIFYYSNSCGWCTKMKPGVEALEKEGYNFEWIEASNTEDSELIDNCVLSYMKSGGVPQFICSKTNEIHVGAFADENSDLDQLALKEWVDNCITS